MDATSPQPLDGVGKGLGNDSTAPFGVWMGRGLVNDGILGD